MYFLAVICDSANLGLIFWEFPFLDLGVFVIDKQLYNFFL